MKPTYFYDKISLNFYNEESFRQMFSTESKHAFYIPQPLSENRVVYGIMWKNMVYPQRP